MCDARQDMKPVFFATLCLAICAAQVVAQTTSWEELTNAARTADQQGWHDEAEKHYQAAIDKAETFGPQDPRLATSLENLGIFYFSQPKHPEAEGLFRRALDSTAGFYSEEGEYAEAEFLYKEEIESKEKTARGGDLILIAGLNDLALFYERQNRLMEAETYYKRGLEQFGSTQTSGDNLMDSNRCVVMRNYARLLRKMERDAEAAEYETGAKKIEAALAPKPLKK